jgi:hypothetical protein
MAATLWTPNFQVSLEKVHITGKQGIFEKIPAVLRIRDVYPGSWIRVFPIPNPGSQIPDPRSQKTWGGKTFFFILSVFLPFCSFPPLLKQILTHNCCTFYRF